jgi:hypothetical protein
VTEDTRAERAVAVTAFENTDDAAFHARPFFCRDTNHITGEAGIEIGGYVDVVPLHPDTLMLACIEARREENGGFRMQARSP